MGIIPDIKGLDFLKGFDLAAFASGVGKIILAILIFALVAGILGFILLRLNKKKTYDQKIFWFEEVNQNMIPVDEDSAKEMTIPHTNVRVFYIKKKDLFLPRGTRRMGKKAYWYGIRNNREIVNFTMKNLNEEMKEAELDYDHTDMRYAGENLRELIKRNYRDKSQPWWREYKDVIALVILIFVISLSQFFLLSKTGDLIGQLAPLIEAVNNLMESRATEVVSSGVATVQ